MELQQLVKSTFAEWREEPEAEAFRQARKGAIGGYEEGHSGSTMEGALAAFLGSGTVTVLEIAVKTDFLD